MVGWNVPWWREQLGSGTEGILKGSFREQEFRQSFYYLFLLAPEHWWISKHRRKIWASGSKSIVSRAVATPYWLTLTGAPFIHRPENIPLNVHLLPHEKPVKCVSMLNNEFGWAGSKSRTGTRFSAHFRCRGKAGAERSPSKRMWWLNHRVQTSTRGWSNLLRFPAIAPLL